MKRLVKTLAALTLVLCLTLCSGVTAFAGSIKPVHRITYREDNGITVTEKTVYKNASLLASEENFDEYTYVSSLTEARFLFRDALLEFRNKVCLYKPYEGYETEGTQLKNVVYYARSEAYNSDGKCGDYMMYNIASTNVDYNVEEINGKSYIFLEYTVDYRTDGEKEEYVDNNIPSIAESLKGATDYDTIKNIHDYICVNTTYYYNAKGQEVKEKQLVYTALTKHKVVCGGYATLFYRLAKELGFNVRTVICKAMNHTWNIIELDGKWYYVDCTFDDEDDAVDDDNSTVTNQNTLYTYFLKGSEDFTDHSPAVNPDNPDYSAYWVGTETLPITDFEIAENGYGVTACAQHNFEEDVTVNAPCSPLYTQIYKCTSCGATKRELLASHPEHTEAAFAAVPMSCTVNGESEYKYCGECKKTLETRTQTKAPGHNEVCEEEKAQLNKDGFIHRYCERCQLEFVNETIPALGTVKIDNTRYDCSGCSVKPHITVLDSNGNAVPEEYYTVTYPEKCKAPGKYTLSVDFKDNYSGSFKFNYSVYLGGTSFVKSKAVKRKVWLKWKPVKGADGYRVIYSANADFTGKTKSVTLTGNRKNSLTVKKLTSKKYYYFKICTVKKIDGKACFSEWSDARRIKAG